MDEVRTELAMEPYIPISFLNDFIFCPRSIYFHQLYGRVSTSLYHTSYQREGQNAHKSIDTKTYTTAKTVFQALDIYSEKYGIGGKIDTYDEAKQLLVERKKRVIRIYDGYIFQLYAQYHALTEMGYQVNRMKLYSMDDNKSYPIKLPKEDKEMQNKFEGLIEQMKNYKLSDDFIPNANKCSKCIYNNLCDVSVC